MQGRAAHQRDLFALFLQLAAESFGGFHSDRVRRFFIEAEQHHALSNCAPYRECTRQASEVAFLGIAIGRADSSTGIRSAAMVKGMLILWR